MSVVYVPPLPEAISNPKRKPLELIQTFGRINGVKFLRLFNLAIPDGQNFRQKLQALAVIKIQISIHQKKALSQLCQTITVGRCELG